MPSLVCTAYNSREHPLEQQNRLVWFSGVFVYIIVCIWLNARGAAAASGEQGEGWLAHCVYYYYVFWYVCAEHDGDGPVKTPPGENEL